jgi:hypothetical protein
MTADNVKIGACAAQTASGLRERNMKRAGIKEADLAQRSVTDKEDLRKRLTARLLKKNVLMPVSGRTGVQPINGVGTMEAECTSWAALLVEAEERIAAHHADDPLTRKFPPPVKYGLVGKDHVFAADEDARADSVIRFVAEEVAQAMDNGEYSDDEEE